MARPGPGSRDPAEVTAKIDGVVVRSSASSVTEACCRAASVDLVLHIGNGQTSNLGQCCISGGSGRHAFKLLLQ